MLTVCTASPYKFASDVYASLTGGARPAELSAPEMLRAFTGVDIPLPLAQLKDKELRHRDSIKKEEMEKATISFAEN